MPFSYTLWVYNAYHSWKEKSKIQFNHRDDIDDYRLRSGYEIARYIFDDYVDADVYNIVKDNLYDALDNTLKYLDMEFSVDK